MRARRSSTSEPLIETFWAPLLLAGVVKLAAGFELNFVGAHRLLVTWVAFGALRFCAVRA